MLTPASDKVLTKLNDPIYTVPASPSGGGVGRGGIEYWLFAASAKGKQSLRLEYRRPREKTSAKAVGYTIAVD
jgi:predicted secreted protein